MTRHGFILRLLLCGLVAPAWGADGMAHGSLRTEAAAPLFAFDLPAQPLGAALNAYADTTGQPVLLPSEITGGRLSAAVRGRHSAAAGLQILLEGSGLVAERRRSQLGQTFVLREAPVLDAPPAPPGMAALFGAEGYAGLVQARVWQALCADRRSRPGDFGAVLRFELDADGRVGRTRLVGSSGDARRDAAVLEALRRVRIERAPPAAIVRQPLTVRIAPEGPGAGPRCVPQDAG